MVEFSKKLLITFAVIAAQYLHSQLNIIIQKKSSMYRVNNIGCLLQTPSEFVIFRARVTFSILTGVSGLTILSHR